MEDQRRDAAEKEAAIRRASSLMSTFSCRSLQNKKLRVLTQSF
jgi:hypothetical protein